jgi:hypothetical protein
MLRIIGILTGSTLAIALLILALGVPHTSGSVTELPDSGSVSEPAADTQVIDSWPAFGPEVPDTSNVPVSEPPVPAVTDPELPGSVTDPEQVEERWYAFWSPFRSEIAAKGFVAKLQESTGLDYRVVRVKTGVYEVAFACTDDDDVQDKLARISNATGLDMSGG